MAVSSTRALAAVAAHRTCPRCGFGRVATQEFCLECGLRLPVVTGALAALRLRWLRGLGWYPGDWVWLALGALVFAGAGAAVAITVNTEHRVAAATTYVAETPQPASPPLPAGAAGATPWPPGQDGWTVALASSPATRGPKATAPIAKRAVRRGLPQVGVLDSSTFSSLHPGYLVVFSGVYGASDDARAALETVRAHGFGGAYVIRVTQ